MPATILPNLYTPAGAAELVGATRETIYHAIDTGRIRFYRLASAPTTVLFVGEDVRAWNAGRLRGGAIQKAIREGTVVRPDMRRRQNPVAGLHTMSGAARHAGVDAATITRAVQSGKLPTLRTACRRLVLIREASLAVLRK